jgi:hypothetical protein
MPFLGPRATGLRAYGEGGIQRVGPDTLGQCRALIHDRDFRSNCWTNLRILGQLCGFQVAAATARVARC